MKKYFTIICIALFLGTPIFGALLSPADDNQFEINANSAITVTASINEMTWVINTVSDCYIDVWGNAADTNSRKLLANSVIELRMRPGVNQFSILGTATENIIVNPAYEDERDYLANGDSTTLDGVDSASFLRSDASDSFTTGTLTTDAGTTVDIDGDLQIADTAIIFNGASTEMTFTGDYTANTSDLVILKSSGAVGVGITNPTASLHSKGSTGGTFAGIFEHTANAIAKFTGVDTDATFANLSGPKIVIQNSSATSSNYSQIDFTNNANIPIASIVGKIDNHVLADGELHFIVRNNGPVVTAMSIINDGKVGIGTSSPTGMVHIDQASASGAAPVLRIDQADVDDSFIDFIGTSAADGSKSISSDTTTDSAKFGAIRIEINGTTKWIRIYDDES